MCGPLLWLFWRWGLENYLPRLASNQDPPNVSLPSSQDYRCEPPGTQPGWLFAVQVDIGKLDRHLSLKAWQGQIKSSLWVP
jgi:hypothetical protein